MKLFAKLSILGVMAASTVVVGEEIRENEFNIRLGVGASTIDEVDATGGITLDYLKGISDKSLFGVEVSLDGYTSDVYSDLDTATLGAGFVYKKYLLESQKLSIRPSLGIQTGSSDETIAGNEMELDLAGVYFSNTLAYTFDNDFSVSLRMKLHQSTYTFNGKEDDEWEKQMTFGIGYRF